MRPLLNYKTPLMNSASGIPFAHFVKLSVAFLAAIHWSTVATAASHQDLPINAFGTAVRNADGSQVNYSRSDLAKMESGNANRAAAVPEIADAPTAPQGFVPASGAVQPFWQYSIFGSGIGASNIVLGPAPSGGDAREIIVGGSSGSGFGGNDFWQVLRRNATTGNYEQLFVSPLYSATIKRIAAGNVIGDSKQELAVMLSDGRIYLYDLITKAELGHITTGVTDLQALSVTDLNGDAVAELIVTNTNDLYVFNGNGILQWQLAGAGGGDVVAGQLDLDPAIEIATTKGMVVDSVTRTAQWTRSGGFGAHLKLAPLPGASYSQLIAAAAWYDVYAYDVVTQLPLWSIRADLDINAIEIADVGNGGNPELLLGDGQWGSVHVYDLATQAHLWEAHNPEHGVTNIAVGDVDNDGVLDLLWGSGWSSTGADYLYVADTTGTHAIKWQSVDLQGPFLGPLIGDLDGDSQPELVVCSYQSRSGYSSGRILVFDLATLTLRGMSAPIAGGFATTLDLKLREVDGDGRMEIVVVAGSYGGKIEVYGFDSSNAFSLEWTNTTSSFGTSFNFVDVADLDGNGTNEIIASGNGSDGISVSIFDYPATAHSWRSLNLGGNGVTSLLVADLNGTGGKEIAALVSNGDLYTFDGATRQLRSLVQQTGATVLADRRSPAGLIYGTSSGAARFFQYSSNSYTESFARQLGSTALNGITVSSDGGLWFGTGSILKLRLSPDYRGVVWQSPVVGPGFGRFVATDLSNGQNRVFSSARHAVAGFAFQASTPTPVSVLGNISTRLKVETGDNVLIGGFIVTGAEPKRVIVRAIGPSLAALDVAEPLANPTLELHGPTGLIASNDDWVNSINKQAIIDSGVAPANDLESAILATLPANNAGYTAVVRGANGGTGTGVVEVYDLNTQVEATMANISTRGRVQTGDNVLIAGTIVVGPAPRKVIVRAIGPSLHVSGRLNDPTLELRDGNGALIEANDNWQQSPNKQAIIDSTIPPSHPFEAAIVQTLPGNNAAYTAIVRGASNSSGIAVVEMYSLEL
jgi:FG-GAP-like repeat